MTIVSTNPLHCIYHPHISTGLHCIRCGQPVCAKCVVHMPVGYQCKTCNNGRLEVYETIRLADYLLGSIVVMTLAGAGSLLSMMSLGLTVLATPAAARLIAGAVQRAVGYRRGRHLGRVVLAAFVIGCLPVACFLLTLGANVLSVIGLLLYVGMGANTLRAELHNQNSILLKD